MKPRLSRRWTAAAGALLVSAGILAAPPGASAAPAPGDFSSSFEPSDQHPTASTPELDASGKPVQGNLTGSAAAGLPGSLLKQVTAVTASGENAPGEVAVNLKDNDSSTKWLVFATTGWVTYHLAAPAAVVKYSLT